MQVVQGSVEIVVPVVDENQEQDIASAVFAVHPEWYPFYCRLYR
jgi:hypothetical protein